MQKVFGFAAKHKYPLALFLVFLAAAVLRLLFLGKLPFDFHEDEILVGYVGRYILQNGKDIYGNTWPLLYFNKFGDYYIIGPMYLAGLSTLIFGITELAVRFPAAILGSLTVFPLYFLAKNIYEDKRTGLIAAAFLSICPWHVNLSRTSAEGILGLFFFTAALAVLAAAIKKKGALLASGSFLLLLIGYFIYHPFRIYPPLLLAAVLFFWLRKLPRRFILLLAAMMIFLTALTAYIGTTNWGSGRLLQTSIFNELSNVGIRNREYIFGDGKGRNNVFVTRMFHNKAVGYGREFLYQYLSYFSPNFLFVKGGNSPRFAIPDQGVFFIVFALMALAAFFYQKKGFSAREKNGIIVSVFLLLLAPLPAAMTIIDSPNIHRTVFMIVPFLMLAAYGAVKIFSSRRIFSLTLLVILTAEFLYFGHQYVNHADLNNSLVRNDGQKQLVNYIDEHRSEYDNIFVPSHSTMALYYLFYTKDFSPGYSKKFVEDAKISRIGNVNFTSTGCPSAQIELPVTYRSLVIDDPNCKYSPRFAQFSTVQGVNPLIGFKLLHPVSLEEAE